MKSKYNKAIVYDIETGGLKNSYNQITEIAMVAVDLENLEIVEEFSVMLEPRINFNWITSALRDAKTLYKELGVKDEETGIKTLQYKEHKITLKNIEPLVKDLEEFYKYLEESENTIWDLEEIQKQKLELDKDLINLFLDMTYNPQVLEVTHISIQDLIQEGVSYNEAYKKVKQFIEKYTTGNNKPIIAGHNIGSLTRRIVKGKEVEPDGFDNPFMEKFFLENNDDWFFSINDEIIDTLKWARLKWSELSNYSLGTCANEVGLTLKEAHRALPDTIANAKFLIKMFQHLRGEGSLKSRYKRRKFNFQM